jgi:hypothetical protein
MKRHRSNTRPTGDLAEVLKQSQRQLPNAAHTDVHAAESVASMIASGRITREVSCDGKKRYRTFEFAEQIVRPSLEARYGKTYEVYPCPYCQGFHMATREELAA